MKALLLALISSSLLYISGCESTPYLELGVGYKTRSADGLKSCSRENFVGRVGVEKRLTKHWVAKGEYEHISHLLCGSPFNEESDESTDHIGGVIRYEW